MNYQSQVDTLWRTINQVGQVYELWAKKKGISYNVLSVLYVVYRAGHCTQKDICEEWLLPKQTVNSVCRELKEKGILLIESETKDKREKTLRLSPEGIAYARPIVEELMEVERNAIVRMDREAADWLLRSMTLYYEQFRREAEYGE